MTPLNVIDIVAIIPFYIELISMAIGQNSNIGFMRIIRCVYLCVWTRVCAHARLCMCKYAGICFKELVARWIYWDSAGSDLCVCSVICVCMCAAC
jgi:hypothetical protein